MKNADYYIKSLKLKPHPEGGYHKETYRSSEQIGKDSLPERYSKARAFYTSIYFLLKGNEVSHFHQLKSDELWHFYAGSSLTIHILGINGNYSQERLGNEMEEGESFQVVVKAGQWFGATVDDKEAFTLAGCTVAPGFDFDDFELGNREQLIELYPEHKSLIEKLTSK